MSTYPFPEAALDFMSRLAQNNERDWFQANKEEYKAHEADVKAFYSELRERLEGHDAIDGMKMFRIYRDVRFSKDKTPYKTHYAGSFSRTGAERRGGYYLRIRPGESFMAAGFWQPDKEDLFRIRKELEADASEFRAIIEAPDFQSVWGTLEGEALKTAPKGFDKTHPDIDLIRYKHFLFSRPLTDDIVLSEGFLEEVDRSFQLLRPWLDLMSRILTTNLNGESLLEESDQ